MSMNVPPRNGTATETPDREPGAYLDGYDDPVIVKTRLRTDSVYHDADETARTPTPACRFADRGSRWVVRERDEIDDQSLCQSCSGEIGGGDGDGGGDTECPFCEKEVHATQLPNHIRDGCSE